MGEARTHERIEIDLGERSYPILIGADLMSDERLLDAHVRARSVLIVTNETVGPLYAAKLRRALGERSVAELALPDGEQHKTLDNVGRILDALIEARMNRDAA